MRYLGVLSYSIYLIHFRAQFVWDTGVVKPAAGGLLPHLVADGVTVAMVLVVAYLAHTLIERPARGYGGECWPGRPIC